MSEIFLNVINMSISASWIVLAVLLLRLLLKKAPKWINVLLWGIVGIRLICPFSIESMLSLIPSAQTVSPSILISHAPEINTGFNAVDNIINPVIGEAVTTIGPEKAVNTFKLIISIFSKLWPMGIAVMLIYALISYLRLKQKVSTAVRLKDNVYQSEAVISPFVLGIIRPKIYLPFNINEKHVEYVILHEFSHIKRRDNIIKPIGFLILALHWFNPLIWLGYVLLCRDIELACDERVIKEWDNGMRADYSEALLNCSVNRRMIAACPLAFGEVSVKERVKTVLSYKKPAFWIVIVAIIAITVTSACLLTSPKGISLHKVAEWDLTSYQKNTVNLLKYDGKDFEGISAFDKDLLCDLITVRVSKNSISNDRSENRDKTHTLILRREEDLFIGIHGLHICFNKDFTEVWACRYDYVDVFEATNTYKVLNPEKAKKIYDDICNYVGADTDKTASEELGSISPDFTIIDRTATEMIATDTAIEEFYRDDNYAYEFPNIKSEYVEVHYTDGSKENIKDALKNGKVKITDLDRFDIFYYKKSIKQSTVYSPADDEKLDSAIKSTLNAKYKSEKPDGLIHIESYIMLDSEIISGTPTAESNNHIHLQKVYLLVYAARYRPNAQNGIDEAYGAFAPTVITFSVDKNSQYSLNNYWTAEKGNNYESDIKNKFTKSAAEAVLNPEENSEILKKYNQKQAYIYLDSLK